MSDDQERKKPEAEAKPEKKQNKVIDVTKPKEKKAPPQQTYSNIDASRVSAYTLKEQQALERLKKKVGHLDQKESKASNIKTIVAIILVVLLIILAILFVVFISKGEEKIEEKNDMRLSMQIENKSALSFMTEAGLEELKKINPGDEVPLRAVVRNSNEKIPSEADADVYPPEIYVRFKLVLILDYEERYDIMIPTLNNNWYRYNKETEDSIPNGVDSDDNYYYYKGSLAYMQAEELFSSILFDGDAITCEDGGKYGQIQVHVESIEANINNIMARNLWETAPQGWIVHMINNYV